MKTSLFAILLLVGCANPYQQQEKERQRRIEEQKHFNAWTQNAMTRAA